MYLNALYPYFKEVMQSFIIYKNIRPKPNAKDAHAYYKNSEKLNETK